MSKVYSKVQNYTEDGGMHAAMEEALIYAKKGQQKCAMLMELAFDYKDDFIQENQYLNFCDNIAFINDDHCHTEKWVLNITEVQQQLPDTKGRREDINWRYGNIWKEKCFAYDEIMWNRDKYPIEDWLAMNWNKMLKEGKFDE